MTKKKLLVIASVFFLTFIYSFALIQVGMYIGRSSQQYSKQATASSRYIVKEYNNVIAVFEEGSDIPNKVLDINIEMLRKQDRQRFQEGIVVNSLDELEQLEEDFCS